jgi:hypothetical protein
VFGFSVTLFTVLYSFILNKREQLVEYSDRIKKGEPDPLIYQRHTNATKFIKNFKKFNLHLIIAIIIDLIVYLFCMGTKYLITDEDFKLKTTYLIGLVTIGIVVYVSVMLIVTINNYVKITKI